MHPRQKKAKNVEHNTSYSCSRDVKDTYTLVTLEGPISNSIAEKQQIPQKGTTELDLNGLESLTLSPRFFF